MICYSPRWDGRVRSPHWLTQNFAQGHGGAQDRERDASWPTAHPRVTIDRLRHGRFDYQPPPRTGSPTVTLAVYGHLFGDTDTRAAEIMEATFSNLGTE